MMGRCTLLLPGALMFPETLLCAWRKYGGDDASVGPRYEAERAASAFLESLLGVVRVNEGRPQGEVVPGLIGAFMALSTSFRTRRPQQSFAAQPTRLTRRPTPKRGPPRPPRDLPKSLSFLLGTALPAGFFPAPLEDDRSDGRCTSSSGVAVRSRKP